MEQLKNQFKLYLEQNEDPHYLMSEINTIREYGGWDDSEYDENLYDDWEDFIDQTYGSNFGYVDVFDSVLSRFKGEDDEVIDSTSELYDIFIDFVCR